MNRTIKKYGKTGGLALLAIGAVEYVRYLLWKKKNPGNTTSFVQWMKA